MDAAESEGEEITDASPIIAGMKRCFTLLLIGTLASFSRAADAPTTPPALPREFRGAWVSSVNNGNWPSKAGLSVDEQKKEMLEILDAAVANNLNAIVFQVRPCADALYKSDIEPWSEYLTGVQGQAPTPYYDPLEMWVAESHKRGLELHAWFNPYRAKHAQSKANIANNSIAKTHPEVVREYGGYLWMDPSEPLAAQQTLDVLIDIVKRYDVDAVHTDDYYYPYKVEDKVTKKKVDFPDDAPWATYQKSGGKLSRGDWRRENVNQLIEKIYTEVHKVKPWVKVGYSPFGIWKPENPPGIKGLNQYEELYADPKLWLNKGWLDYISPQLYWKIEGDQSFPKLLGWWVSENKQHRHVWPGMAMRNEVKEVINQIDVTRKTQGAGGTLFWNIKSVMRKKELSDALINGPYEDPALIPASPWLSRQKPARPQVTTSRAADGSVIIKINPADEKANLWAVQGRYGSKWKFAILPATQLDANLGVDKDLGGVSHVAISAIDRVGNQGVPFVALVAGKVPRPAATRPSR